MKSNLDDCVHEAILSGGGGLSQDPALIGGAIASLPLHDQPLNQARGS